jgi:ribose transport system substrate-binding protein
LGVIVKLRPSPFSWLIVIVATLFLPSQNLAKTTLADTSQPYRVGVLYWSMNIPGQVAMRQGLEATLEKLNSQSGKQGFRSIELITHVAGDGPQGIENQISQMDSLLDLKPDLIIVQPTDNAALAGGLLRANREGIPVVAYDQYISGKGKLDCFLTSNNYQAGFHCGEYIASRFDSSQTLKIILVEYPHVSSTVERVNGFIDGLSMQN